MYKLSAAVTVRGKEFLKGNSAAKKINRQKDKDYIMIIARHICSFSEA